MEHPRTDSARDHDDRTIIDAAEEASETVGRAGGNLQRNVGTQDEQEHVADPESHHRVTKSDAIDHDQDRPTNRARGA